MNFAYLSSLMISAQILRISILVSMFSSDDDASKIRWTINPKLPSGFWVTYLFVQRNREIILTDMIWEIYSYKMASLTNPICRKAQSVMHLKEVVLTYSEWMRAFFSSTVADAFWRHGSRNLAVSIFSFSVIFCKRSKVTILCIKYPSYQNWSRFYL